MIKTIKNGLFPVHKLKGNNNEFPVHVLPKHLQIIIQDAKDSLNFSEDYFASSILFAYAVVLGNRVRVKIKSEWVDSATIFMALIGPPGTLKSHPPAMALRPIKERDKEQYKQYQKQLCDDDEKAAKGAKWKKSIVSDYTPESLAPMHEVNSKGLGVYIDELAGFFKNFNRYHNGSEREFYMSVWAGIPINIDRKNGRSYYIENPSISICGTIQPKVLIECKDFLKSGSGFFERFLYVIPAGGYKMPISDNEMPADSVKDYTSAVYKLISYVESTKNDESDTKVIKFTDSAKEVYKKWNRENTNYVNGLHNEEVQQILIKYDNHFLRLALILQAIKFSFGVESLDAISEDTATKTIDLVRYFISGSIDVYEMLDDYTPLGQLTGDRFEFYNTLETHFKTGSAIALGISYGLEKRTVQRFLKDKKYFQNIRHGEYLKRYDPEGEEINAQEWKENEMSNKKRNDLQFMMKSKIT